MNHFTVKSKCEHGVPMNLHCPLCGLRYERAPEGEQDGLVFSVSDDLAGGRGDSRQADKDRKKAD